MPHENVIIEAKWTIDNNQEITENPKTGVEDFIGLLILSIMCVVLFIINKDKVSTFKEI